MSFKLKPLAALVAAGLCGLAVNASAYTTADLGVTGFDFQIKYNNYEFLNADPTVGSGATNTGGLYLGDNFGIFNVTSIQHSDGTPPNLWNAGAPGNTIPILSGVFWGFDVYNSSTTNARASGGHIAIFANSTFTQAIREQGPAAMVGTGTTTIDGVNMPTYAGITTGTLLLVADYQNGCDAGDLNATLCAPVFIPAGGSFIGAAKGYADVNPTAGDLGAAFDTGSLLTDIPGVFRDLSVQSNFSTPALSGLPVGQTTNWPVWSFDPVFGRAVPEPTTLALLGAGFAAFGLGRRNKKA